MDGNRKRHGRHEGRGKGPRRDPAKERFWRQHQDEQRRSGLSVRAYCRGARVSEALFYQWRREIARRDAETGVGKSDSGRRGEAGSRPGFVEPGSVEGPSATASARPGFIELRPLEDFSAARPVEVVLRNGRVLRVGRGFDPDLVVELAAVLEGSGSC